MNPHLQNKVDISSLSPEEARLFRLYGIVPKCKGQNNIGNLKERRYFDSGDYALSKAGKPVDIGFPKVGREHPQPENIPHPHETGLQGPTDLRVASLKLPQIRHVQVRSSLNESSDLQKNPLGGDTEDKNAKKVEDDDNDTTLKSSDQ